MAPELIIKISNDVNLHKYLIKNSNWYKYLNRNKNNFKMFYNAFKINSKSEKISKASGVVDTLGTVNSILKILK